MDDGAALPTAAELVAEYDDLFGGGAASRQRLLAAAQSGALRHKKLHSLCWKTFMGLLPPVTADGPAASADATWPAALAAKRAEYAALKEKYVLDPSTFGDDDDPLSMAVESPWAKFHENQELVAEIDKDMERLYPTGCDEYFVDKEVAALCQGVLFVWSRMHEDVSYRQGMHELLAPIVWLTLREQAALQKVTMMGSAGAAVLPAGLVAATAPEHAEADIFWCFSYLMGRMKPMFEVNKAGRPMGQRPAMAAASMNPLGGALAGAVTGARAGPAGASEAVSPVLRMAQRIQNELLKGADPTLHARLDALMIEPQIYAMRWVRLIFGREFHIEDVIVIWDAIFQSETQEFFRQMEFISAAMLM